MPNQTEWNLSLLVPDFSSETVEREKQARTAVIQTFIQKWKSDTSYLTDVVKLREALDEVEAILRTGGVGGDMSYAIGLYAVLDEASAERRGLSNNFDEFERKLHNEWLFFFLNLSKVPVVQQEIFLAAPELEKYHTYLVDSFEEGSHLLTELEEKLDSLKSGVSYRKWEDMTSGLISAETRMVAGVEKTFEELLSLMSDPNKEIRDEAAAGIHSITHQYRKVAENEINAILENKKIEDDLRGWEYPESHRLFSDGISKEVVDAMTEVVAGANSVAQEYYALKAQVLGVKKLAYHERGLSVAEVEKEYLYEDAFALVKKVVGQLDPEFAEIFEGFSTNGQIDVFPRKGKRGGAACWHNDIAQPTYILLNHTNKIGDVTTLAHELGHGINNEMMRQKQHALYFSTPISTAEVASTFMEDFVLREIMQEATQEERLALLFEKMDDVVSTIFRQVACYRFEQSLHAAFRTKGYVSAEEIGQLFQAQMAAYMGDAVEQSEGAENWWVYWSHIRSFFYVYSYASGLLISMALQAKTRENPAFIAQVKEFLSAGCSARAEEVFKKAGIDITQRSFWESGIAELRELLEETRELSRQLGKI